LTPRLRICPSPPSAYPLVGAADGPVRASQAEVSECRLIDTVGIAPEQPNSPSQYLIKDVSPIAGRRTLHD